MASITKPLSIGLQDTGFRLVEGRPIEDAIVFNNGQMSTYGITAAGTTAATATQLGAPLNQVDTGISNSGVALPLSTGKRNTAFQNCVVVNNTGNSITVYGFPTSADTINGIAGATGISIATGSTVGFVSVKGGAWFTGDVSEVGQFTSVTASGNITETGLGFGFVQKAGTNGRAGTFTLNGATPVTVSNTTTAITDAIIISLNTVGGSVGVQPHVATITASTGFTVIGTAGDTSIYNYSMIGTN